MKYFVIAILACGIISCGSTKEVRRPYFPSEKEKEIESEIASFPKQIVVGNVAIYAKRIKQEALEKKWQLREQKFLSFPDIKFKKENNTQFSTILTNGVLFETDSYELTSESKRILRDIYKLFLDEEKRYDIIGYTDNIGRESYNLKLSENRAIAVGNFFRELGAENVYEKGKGESYPIASNDTKEGRMKNRRVEIKIQFIE